MNTEALIDKYLSNTADETDLQQIITQLNDCPAFREQFVESVGMAGLIAATDQDSTHNEEAIMCGIGGGQCSLEDVEAVMASLESAPSEANPKKATPIPFFAVAITAVAAIILALLLIPTGDQANQPEQDLTLAPPPPNIDAASNGTLVQYDSVPAGIPEMHLGKEPQWAPIGPVELSEINGPTVTLANQHVQRVLKFDGHVWRTTAFSRADGTDTVNLYGHEFRILTFDGTELTSDDYKTSSTATIRNVEGVKTLTLKYVPRQKISSTSPSQITITYTLNDDDHWTRKTIDLTVPKDTAIDRLDVERFVTSATTSRGGRGEPTFLNDQWYLGLEFPAGHTRHPRYQARPYAHIGNHSHIDLDGYDREYNPPAGLVAAFHFPGIAKQRSIRSKTSVIGVAPANQSIERGFYTYLDTIRRPSRTNLNYNNWYDQSGKDLRPAVFADRIAKSIQENLAPYGVSLDAMVPDNGWQNRQSIAKPNKSKWPDGLSGLATRLEKQDASLGIWIAANNYNSDVNWAAKQGYPEAERNERFSRFQRYQCIVPDAYQKAIRDAIKTLFTEGKVSYVKHDFNNMCCQADGHGHLPTDRHGHEASVNAMIDLLAYERKLNPEVYQNLTNWIWFSPWWLQHTDSIWMLGKDSALAATWPQQSKRAMAITYRDSHIQRIWGDPATRPLVPISTLMTHGIIFSDRNRMGDKNESLRDWADYVMAYYGRGVQLHELYVTPGIMTADRWQVLGQATRWATDNHETLKHAVYIGGDAAKGEPYGYVAWNKDRGILTARNPHLHPQTLEVPIDDSTWYQGPMDQMMHARVIYPHQGILPQTFASGQRLRLTIPGHTLMTLELKPGPAASDERLPASIVSRTIQNGVELTIPDRTYRRMELVTTSSGTTYHQAWLNGTPTKPTSTQSGKGWTLHTIDLQAYLGQKLTITWDENADAPFSKNRLLDAWIVADQQTENQQPTTATMPLPVANGFRRKTQLLMNTGQRSTAALTAADLAGATAAKLHVSLFGVNPGKQYAGHTILLNGTPIATLPANRGGDSWESRTFDVPASMVSDGLGAHHTVVITNPKDDCFKIANVQLAVKTKDGRWALSNRPKSVHVSTPRWAYAEGTPFSNNQSQPIRLRFNLK